jgi:hypothetical protein
VVVDGSVNITAVQYLDHYQDLVARPTLSRCDVPGTVEGRNFATATLLIVLRDPLGNSA